MKILFQIGLILGLSLFLNNVFAYGSGSSSKACEKPSFSKFQPTPDATVPTFSDFSFTASSNTSAPSLEVTISSGSFKQAFKAKDLTITELPNGGLAVKGQLQTPLTEGFARLNIAAKSKRGCDKADGYLIKLGTGGQ